jgi:tetratricopeptide (TPR) repeat protein
LSNALLGVLAVSVIMIVLLGSGLLAKPVVIGVVFAVGTVLSIIILMWLSALYVPTGLIWLRGAAGRRKDLYRGIRHTLRGELDKARDLLQRYEVQFPDDSRALYWQAMLFLLENEHPAALRLTQRALAIERRPETLVLRGQLMLRAGDKEQALADGEEAVDLNSRLPGVTDFVAAMLVTERRLDRAIELLEPARPAQRTPNRGSFWRRLTGCGTSMTERASITSRQ